MWAAVADVWRLGACVCDDESESEIIFRHLNLSTKVLAWEKQGGEGLKKKNKNAPTIYKTPIRKKETSKCTPTPRADLTVTHIHGSVFEQQTP